ncbi:ankyrin repeat domain-containing protein [Gloeobacter kilaueensis]|uniref:Ankyrin repeat protein n=1 Tax=Gloeobacter kilaueensis (strain ATCC BAA-2537 / CCAP 1431/1 / ULC 316 / JS1) TaxID=1183438 RepID=U5QKJ6_GLOK1|nr:ankyrin repeat domain-containing protein [Gloeobacter kilaueensis]AGY59502.1 ankyrin repeat protein [Gloeobacter kilaueensis JS1]
MKICPGLLVCFLLLAAPALAQSDNQASGDSAGPRCAWKEHALPLKVFIEAVPQEAAAHRQDYLQAVQDGIKAWNDVGIGGKPVFEQTNERREADVLVSWQLPPNPSAAGFEQKHIFTTGGGASYSVCAKSRVTLIIEHWARHQIPTGLLGYFVPVPVPIPNINTENLEQRGTDELRVIATHELGHSLGLDHSDDSGDIMYPVEGQKFIYYGIEFTNVQVLTEKSKKNLGRYYEDAWLDFRLARLAAESRRPGQSVRSGNSASALVELAGKGENAAVERLLAAGQDINGHDDSGWTALIAAAAEDHPQTVALLIEKGAQLDARDNNGYTALRYARAANYKQVIDLLIHAGARY